MSKRKRYGETDEENSESSRRIRDAKAGDDDSHILDHSDYTVGWICALTKERVAAILMLDKTHPDLPNPLDDRNSYTLGSIGKHNIVIACLPKGQYGTISAAKVALWMTSTFPSIRVGLMVGIGGGIPSKVRLGDVVVSTPVDKDPGVIQWDMGKAEDAGSFTRTGSLNNPPTVLLAASTKLETHHTIYGSKISQYLGEIEQRHPKLDLKYTRSESLIDPLLTDGEKRKPGQMQVHYGLIASGNQVIKDSAIRDQLDKSLGENVLCVEMEAAGLMNDFPCIVIRGVCDYADSRKNKDWQEYAAMMAAGCARELLELVEPYDIQHTLEARNVINTLQNIASRTENIVKTQEQRKREEEFTQLFTWLSPLTPSARHSEHQKQRVNGTGTWLLEDPKFMEWSSEETSNPVLCCYGDPGAGKTIICSVVVDKLVEEEVAGSKIGLGYVYCDYRDQSAQTVENIIGAILLQLLRPTNEMPSEILNFHQTQLKKGLPFSSTDAKYLLRISGAKLDKAYICLDALDELANLGGVLEILRERPPNVRLFLTGRPHVQDTVQKYLGRVSTISIMAKSADIERFIENEIGGPNDAEPDAMDDRLRKNILIKVAKSSKGIFLLPVLQMRDVLQNLTISERERSLETMPSSLGEAFAGSFTRINQQSVALSSRAAHIIAWIHLASRPLKINEVLCSLTIKQGDKSFDDRGIPIRKTLLNCCCGLVIMDQETRTVRLVHYSLEEYLKQQSEIFKIPKTEWHGRIAATLLTYLEFSPPSSWAGLSLALYGKGYIDRSKLFISSDIQIALREYGSIEWGHHLRQARNSAADALGLAMEYLRPRKRQSDSLRLLYGHMCKSMHESTRGSAYQPWTLLNSSIGLPMHSLRSHIPAFFGVPDLLIQLSDIGLNLDERDIFNRTPLSQAAAQGHCSAVKLLLAHPGVEVNAMDEIGWTPLMYATRQGQDAAVQLFLAHPAVNIHLRDNEGFDALLIAAKYACTTVIQLLLACPTINVNTQGSLKKSPLFLAAEAGHSEVVSLLSAHPGVNIHSKDNFGRTPLMIAAENGHTNALRVLIERPEANINLEGYGGSTALSDATRRGHVEIVRLFLAQPEVDINHQDFMGNTVLSDAAARGHMDMMRLILAHPGLAINITDSLGATALSNAVKQDHIEIVRLLLTYPKLNINSKDLSGRSALSLVAEKNQVKIAQLLLERPGIDVNSRDNSGWTPLSWAARNYSIDVLPLLLSHPGLDINADADWTSPALCTAVWLGDTDITKLILTRPEVDVNIKDKEGKTALSWAASMFDAGIVRLLLACPGLDINMKDRGGMTALSQVAGKTPRRRSEKRAQIEIVQLLLAQPGAEVNLDEATLLRFRAAADELSSNDDENDDRDSGDDCEDFDHYKHSDRSSSGDKSEDDI